MKISLPYLLLGLGLSLLSVSAGAQPAPVHAPIPAATPLDEKRLPAMEVARWKVFYFDSFLGLQMGDAVVDWKNLFATVQYRVGGRVYRLESELVLPPSATDPRCQIRFTGRSPELFVTAKPDLQKAQRVIGAGEARVKLGSQESSFAFGEPDAPDADTVTVDLVVDGDADMRGRWRYDADPVTLRNERGGSRAKFFSMAPDGSFAGQQSGPELWLQKLPEVNYVAELDDQLEIPHAITGVQDRDGRSDQRILFVVGHYLPVIGTPGGNSYNVGKLESGSADATYTYLGQSGDLSLNPKENALIRRGWMQVCRRIDDPAQRRAILASEGALIKVQLKRDFVPGKRDFTWGGTPIPWRLESRDARVDVRVVRKAYDNTEWEAAPEISLPEDIAIEIRLPVPIPYESFVVKVKPFTIDAEGEGKAAGPEQEFIAKRTSPKVYRTELMPIDRPGGTGWTVPDGATLIVHARPSVGLLSAPATVQVRAFDPTRRSVPLWTDYVRRVASLNGNDTTDLGDLALRKETKISNTLVVLLRRLNANIYYGDHAAMLLLRDTFADQMRRANVALGKSVATDAGALGYAKLSRAVLQANPEAPRGKLNAGTLEGVPVTLAEALDPAKLQASFADDLKARDYFLVRAVRTAVADQRAQLQKSLATVEAIQDDEIEKLLRLTGNGFQNVVNQAAPRLMRLDMTTHKWVADHVARAYVLGLSAKYQEVRNNQEASDIDTALVVGVAASFVGLPTGLSQSATAYAVSAAGNGLLLATQAGVELYVTSRDKDELAFAFAAAPVLGEKRYQAALLLNPSWLKTFLLLGLNVATAGVPIYADLSQMQTALQLGRGARLAENTSLSLYGISRLAENEQRDLLAFLANARSLRLENKVLSSLQNDALNALDRLAVTALEDQVNTAKALAISPRVTKAQQAVKELLDEATAVQSAAVEAAAAKAIALKATKEELAAAKALAAKGQLGLLDSLKLRSDSLNNLWRIAEKEPRILATVTDFDLAWYSGAIMKAEEKRAVALITAHDLSWHDLKIAFQDGKVSAAEMHNFVTYREDLIVRLLDESIADVRKLVEQETKTAPKLTKLALGSTNLTSDLDYSAFGVGAERVVKMFNEKFRALPEYRGLESGFVFDTNVYTQAVYELFQRKTLTGASLGIANADLDALRQMMYEQMATRKYIGGTAAWEKHTAALLAAAPDEATRKMLKYTFEEADYAYKAARSSIARQLGVKGEEALHAAEGTNALLRATNNSYENLLGDIDLWRNESLRLQRLTAGVTEEYGPMGAAAERYARLRDGLLERYPGWREGFKELTAFKAAGNEAEYEALAKTWRDRLAYQLRKKQGEALFYASEAYQAEASILHVVSDLQGEKRAKLITLAKLSGSDATRASKFLTRTDARGGLNSMMENHANLLKELHHAEDAEKAATKGGKYFIRVLDAGHESGIDVIKVAGKELVEQTIAVDALRADSKKVVEYLRSRGTTEGAYVEALEAAHERLGIEMVTHKDITSFAGRLQNLFEDMPGAAEATQKAAALGGH